MINMKTLVAGMIGIGLILAAYASVLINSLVYPLIGGTVSAVATSGDIPVDSNFSAAIANISETGAGYFTQIFGNVNIVIGLIALVIILMIFDIKFGSGAKKAKAKAAKKAKY